MYVYIYVIYIKWISTGFSCQFKVGVKGIMSLAKYTSRVKGKAKNNAWASDVYIYFFLSCLIFEILERVSISPIDQALF